MEYNQFIKNKKVIFVGPAPTLRNEGKGEWINNEFDVVVRTNGSIFLLGDLEYCKDYGNRCDVLYSNVQFHREMGPFPVQDWIQKHGLKYLNLKTDGYSHLYKAFLPTRGLMHIIGPLQKLVKGLLMGPIILQDIVDQEPKSLYVTGMNFYINKPEVFIPGDWREYFPNYIPYKIRNKADVANIGRIDRHCQHANTKFIYELFCAGKIEVDDFMKELMPIIVDHPEIYSDRAKYGD